MSDVGGGVLEPFFLAGAAGKVFCVFTGPEAGNAPRSGVLLLPPFAEEMNKARRQMALHARALAAAGCGVLLPDLYGTGDSDGEFGDARWEIWRQDSAAAADWLVRRGFRSVAVVGFRAGALLAVDLVGAIGGALARLVLIQPVISGRRYMDQFLRLRIASSLVAGAGADKVSTRDLRKQLENGRTLEVAGYDLHADLLQAMDGRDLSASPPAQAAAVDWIEVGSNTDGGIGMASQRVIEDWRKAGVDVRPARVAGDPFWSTAEIATAPGLIDLVTRLLAGRR